MLNGTSFQWGRFTGRFFSACSHLLQAALAPGRAGLLYRQLTRPVATWKCVVVNGT
jgi:hypothetical protein